MSNIKTRKLNVINRGEQLIDHTHPGDIALADDDHFQTIINTLNEGLVMIADDFTVRFVNNCFCRLVGYSSEEIIGRSPLWFVEPKCHEQVMLEWTTRKVGSQNRFEITLNCKDGSNVIVLASPKPIFSSDGRFLGNIDVLTDITSLKKIQKENEQAYNELDNLLNITASGIRIMDRDLNIIKANPAFSQLCGLSLKQILGRKCYDTFSGPYCHTTYCPVIQLSDYNQNSIEYDIKKTRSNGKSIHCKLTAKSLTNQNGEVIGVLEDFTDITAYKKVSEELDTANLRLEAEQAAVKAKNTALKEVLDQVEQKMQRLAHQMQDNVNRIVMPTLHSLKLKSRESNKNLIDLIESSLFNVLSPFVSSLNKDFQSLTPREIEICNMIRQQMSSKEIANALNTAEGTVEQQRKNIRKKLGISGSCQNLTSFLKANYN